jgi:hypothetical protein
MAEFRALLDSPRRLKAHRMLFRWDARRLAELPFFRAGQRVDLVVTSPPYPGVHVLYHRWQLGGRRETPAPYWLADCQDGRGAAYYNFGNRHETALDGYFGSLAASMMAIRSGMKDGAAMVQLIALNNPGEFLDRYISTVASAGFAEVRQTAAGLPLRIQRSVPRRNWHAALKGDLASSKEIVLVHAAV